MSSERPHVFVEIVKILCIVFLILLGLFGWFLWSSGRQYAVSQIPFSAEEWRRADPIENHRTVRSQMIGDLLRHYDFHGWTRQQVEELLGPPEPKPGFEYGFYPYEIVYILGLERFGAFSLDTEALGFSFDDDGKVTKYGLTVN